MDKVKVIKSEFNALNEWYANGFTGMDLIRNYIGCKDNGLPFKDPYKPLTYLDGDRILKIASKGVGGYELLLTSDELIKERYDNATEEERELMVWLLNTVDEYVEGVNFKC